MGNDRRDAPRWRRRLGRVGVWAFSRALDEDPGALAHFVESLGYTGLWIGGGNVDEPAFAHLGTLLGATREIVVATGITNIWAWDPAALAGEAARLEAAFPDRFVLGLGVSHAPLVEGLGRRYERPYDEMAGFLDVLDTASEGAPPRVLAALGPRMLRLSAARSAGAHPYLTTPEHTRRARATLGPDAILAPEQAFVLDDDPARARRTARAYLERYLQLPNYVNNLRALGWTDDQLVEGGGDALVDRLVVHGNLEQVAAGVLAHFEAGADHVCVQALSARGTVDRHALEVLAPLLGVSRPDSG